jgi:hypothetical protein
MSRTPIIRRIAAIAVAIAIPFATAASAEAYTPRSSDGDSAPAITVPVDGGALGGPPVKALFRSSWS